MKPFSVKITSNHIEHGPSRLFAPLSKDTLLNLSNLSSSNKF